MNVTGSVGVNSLTPIVCSSQDGQESLDAEEHFWTKMDAVTNPDFSDFTRDMKDEAEHKLYSGKSNVITFKTLELGDGGGGIAGSLGITATPSQIMVPNADFWTFDEVHWSEGHDKRVCEEFTEDQRLLFPNVYPSAPDCTDDSPASTETPVESSATEVAASSTDCSAGVFGSGDTFSGAATQTGYGSQSGNPSTPDATNSSSEFGVDCNFFSSESEGTQLASYEGENTVASLEGDLGSWETSADGSAMVNLEEGTATLEVGANGEASVYELSGEVEHSSLDGALTGNGTGEIDILEVEAEVSAALEANWAEGSVTAEGSAGIGANIIEAEGAISGTLEAGGWSITAEGNASAAVGANASASGEFSISSSGITIGGNVAAALGLGAGIGGSITISWPPLW
ncbi:hypothetical protein GCM10007939_15810 [Amylibacter marinus]|uniref:Uncharacterized protein n=1 Tax=Amylibacter marinus TaxID=1475483 RepID=A0ABQ5VVK5_9RHOB|nr:hypothetical protein GCM10007939_15810 [Amylibacter marinus]